MFRGKEVILVAVHSVQLLPAQVDIRKFQVVPQDSAIVVEYQVRIS